MVAGVLGLIALCVSTTSTADTNPSSQYKTYLTKAQTVDPVGDFGEQISLREGKLSFRNVDIEVPGIGPTIRIVRTAQLDEGYGKRMTSGNAVGGWEIEIPRLKTITADPVGLIHANPLNAGSPQGWQVPGTDMNARCAHFNKPPTVSYGNTLVEFYPANWWFGYQLVDDAGNEHTVATRAAGLPGPQYTLGTTTGHWVIDCLPQTSNGEPGDAFQAISPDGTKYWLDRLTYSGYSGLTMPFADMPPKGYTLYFTLPRKSAAMMVTRVEDRFGNWLKYNYSGSRVTSIDASDGRKVTLAWQTDGVTITVGTGSATRTWSYAASGSNNMQITQPDGSKWQYTGDFHMPRTSNYVSEGCSAGGLGYEQTGTRQVSVSAPSGATATFALKQTFFGRSYVPKYCSETPSWENPDPGYALYAKAWVSYAMTTKTVTGPGLPTMTWSYSYSPHNAAWLADCPNNSCPDEVWTDVVDPNGDKVRSTFSNRWDQTENKLLREDTYDGGQLLRTQTYTYATTPSNGANPYPWPLFVAGFTNYNSNPETDRRWTPVKQKIITQQGTTFTWQANSYDAWSNPLSVTRASAPGGYTRTDVAAYHHNLAKWVIGQVASSTNSNTGLVESKTDYDAQALPWRTWSFGKLQQTLAYHTDGTLKTVTDGNNHTTTLADWKRGLPQKITFADTKYKSAVVDDLGQIASVTDENGYTTQYGYDAMGRLNLIDYPDDDTVNWVNTTLSFAKSGSAIYGLTAGHWQQTVVTGNARQVTYFDALWRPVVQATYDNANVAGTLSQTVTRYDADGRPTFVSYPQRSQVQAVYNTWGNPAVNPNALGVWNTYDALGRPTKVQQNSELGVLNTTYEYLAGFQTRITNPRSFKTTTRYMAYDQPTSDWPTSIVQPEGVLTEITRDTFGKPLGILRHNADNSIWNKRHFAYDANQQLCKTSEVETSTTAYGYDAAGNLEWSAAALPWSPAAPCGYSKVNAHVVPRRVDRTYDARNRLETLTFPDGRGDQQWQYWPDGLVKQITTYNAIGLGGLVDNAYAYNKRRLPQTETIAEPGNYSWSLGYGYNVNGHLASHQYPSGLAVNYAPNALGQPTQAGSYATGVSYYPNGGMQQFTYGNGIVHTLTQNERQLPDTSRDAFGGTPFLDDGYDYDQNGNVAAISDGTVDHRGNRTMTYDGLDRLTDVVSPMYGAPGAMYRYDTLDNLTRVRIGGAATRDHWYCYDAHNQLTNVKTGSCEGTSVIGLGYDVQGNLANKNGQIFDFDYGNRLREATGKETYRYDGHGRRVAAQAAAGTIYSFYGQDGALRSQRDERKTEAYDHITLNGSLVARVTAATPVLGVPVLTAPPSDPDGDYPVQWTTVTGATLYELQESTNGEAWQAAYAGAGTNQAIAGKPEGSYGYRARACKNDVCGNWSATATVVVNLPPAMPPTLTAPATAPNGNYDVNWNAVDGATSYTLEQSANGGIWTLAYDGPNLSRAYAGQPAGSYAYRVKACNDIGCSGYSATKTVQAFHPPAAPALSAPASSITGSYTVSWAVVAGATSYRLEESINNGAWSQIQDAAATSKNLSGKANGNYRYRAQACNLAGCSGYSAIKTVTVLKPPASAPGLTAPASNTTGSYPVSWTAVAGASSYTLQRSVNGGTWSNRYSGANLSFNEAGLGQGSYGYRVQACNGSGCSGWSAVKTTQVLFPPAMPASLTGHTEPDPDLMGSRFFYVNWSAVAGATYYELKQNGAVVYSGVLAGYMTSGKGTRTFYVRACNTAGCSAWKGPLTL